MSSEGGGKRGGSMNEELAGADQIQTNSKYPKDTVTLSSSKKGRSAPLRTTKSATSKQQSTQKRGEQAGRLRVKKVDGSTTTFSTEAKSGRITRSQTQNSKNAKLSDSSVPKKIVGSTAAKVRKIVTRSSKGCSYSPSPPPESDTSESLAISSDYEESEFLINCCSTIIAHDSAFWFSV